MSLSEEEERQESWISLYPQTRGQVRPQPGALPLSQEEVLPETDPKGNLILDVSPQDCEEVNAEATQPGTFEKKQTLYIFKS